MKTTLALILLFFALSDSQTAKKPSAYACLQSDEKRLYDLIMDYRKGKKLKRIRLSEKLTRVAQTHAHDLADYFNYENTQNCNPHSWSDKGAWTSCCYTPDHQFAPCMWSKPEEISGYQGDGFEIAYYNSEGATPQESLTAWIKSEGHNPLLINSGPWSEIEWNAIGIGIYKQYATVWFGEVEDADEAITCR